MGTGPEDSVSAPARAERQVEDLTVAELSDELRKLSLPLLDTSSKHQLAKRLKQWLEWTALSPSGLRSECSNCGVPPKSVEAGQQLDNEDEQREFLLVHLVVHSWCLPAWKVRDVKLHWIDDAQQILAIVRECEHYESLTRDDVESIYEKFGLPRDSGVQKKDLISRLRKVFVWNALSKNHLRQECQDRNLNCDDPSTAEEDVRERMLRLLYVHMCPNYCELMGIPSDRFESAEAAVEVAQLWLGLQQMSVDELKDLCLEWYIFLPDGLQEDQYLGCLRLAVVWWWLPMQELEKECRSRNVEPDKLPKCEENERRGLLLTFLLCSLSGVPVDRLETSEAALEVAQQYYRLDNMTKDDMEKQCEEWSIPLQKSFTREEYLTNLQFSTLWWELPFAELKKECEALQISSRATGDNYEKCGQLIDRLLFAAWGNGIVGLDDWLGHLDSLSAACQVRDEWKRIDGAALVPLRAMYEEMGLPSHGIAQWEICDRLKQIHLWSVMPLESLQKQCRQYGCNSIARTSQELAPRLAHHCWGSWTWNSTPQRSSVRPAPSYRVVPPKAAIPKSPAPPRTGKPTPPQATRQPPRSNPKQTSVGAAGKLGVHFKTLGLPETAGQDDVKKTYRRLALKHHPDKNPEGARQFVLVSSAYSAIMDHFKSRSQ